MLNSVVCQCCGHQEMRSITQFKEYAQMLCDSCGYVRFLHLSKQVSHLLYEDDSDYNDDLDITLNELTILLLVQIIEDYIYNPVNKVMRRGLFFMILRNIFCKNRLLMRWFIIIVELGILDVEVK